KEWYEELERIRLKEIRDSRAIEFTVYCKDETVKQVEISFAVDDNLFYTTYNDITARKKFENALQENEEKFRNISEQLPIPIGVFAVTGETKFINYAFTSCFGYEKDDIPTLSQWFIYAFPDELRRNEVKAEQE